MFIYFLFCEIFIIKTDIPKYMTLNTLVAVLTSENIGDLSDKLRVTNMSAKFWFGVHYMRSIDNDSGVPSKIPVIELVYEAPKPASLRLWEYLMLEKSDLLNDEYKYRSAHYKATLHSFDELESGIKLYSCDMDERYRIFGSRKLFKAFFDEINKDRLNGVIKDEEYMRLFDEVERRCNKMICELGNARSEDILEVIKEFRNVFRSNTLIVPYLARAKSIVNA